MFRLKIALLIGGCVLAFFGIQEYRVSSGSSHEPVEVSLAELEKGGTAANNHIKLGDHFALYLASVYEYRQGKYETGSPGPSTSVNHAYYPIVSPEHPFILAIANEDTEYDFDSFAVLVKTKRFDTIGSIPEDIAQEASVQGLVINAVGSLDSEERELVKESFPRIDLDKVLILEEGRKPSSLLMTLGMVVGGVLISLASVAWFFLGGGS